MESLRVPPGSVVVGIDGSQSSDRALQWGVRQAALEDRPIALVHATSPTIATTWMGAPAFNPASVLLALEDAGRTALARAADAVHAHEPGLQVYRVFDPRDPRDALIDQAQHAALVVVGSRGHGPMASLVLGSVSLAVSQHASCPVVVVRKTRHQGGGGIVVGADGTTRSDAALGFAFRQAALLSLPLTAVHASGSDGDEADREARRLLLAASVAGLEADFPDVKVDLHVQRGLPDRVLLHACETADLTVVGSHPANALHDLLAGDVSRSVLAHARCAVAVVPDPL